MSRSRGRKEIQIEEQKDYSDFDQPESHYKISAGLGSRDISPMSGLCMPDGQDVSDIEAVPYRNLSEGKYSGGQGESQLASSSGGAHSVNSLHLAKLAVMTRTQLREIRAYTANELFKVRK